MSTTAAAPLRAHALARPTELAIRFPAAGGGFDSRTWAELDAEVDATARGLVAAGLRAGDRMIFAFRPSIHFHLLVFGLWRMGGVPVFIDPAAGVSQAFDCVRQSQARGIVAAPLLHPLWYWPGGPFGSIEVWISSGLRCLWRGHSLSEVVSAPGEGPPPVHDPSEDSDAVLIFTSGSTGPPKAVALTHRCMAARVRHTAGMFGLQPGDRVVESLLVYTVLELLHGMTVVVPQMDVSRPATVDPNAVLDAVSSFSPSVLSASPVVWQKLARHCQQAGKRIEVERLLTGAAPIPVDLHQRLQGISDAQLWTPYGATEALPIASIGSTEILRDTADQTAQGAGVCVGQVAPGIEVRILENTPDPIPSLDRARECRPGELGEITVCGEGVSASYRSPAGADRMAKIADGPRIWHRTGDLGTLDASGRLWFCGRKAHQVGDLPSVAVEGVYNVHPAVYRTALVGPVPTLCVELEPGQLWSQDLEASLRQLGEGTRWEGGVRHVLHHPGAFPTDVRHNSKIRRELLARWADERLRGIRPAPADAGRA